MTFLHLVRHGRPLQIPTIPARDWPLAPDAATAIETLRGADVLPHDAFWVSSPEAKARATGSLLTGGAVRVDDGLREAGRPDEYLDKETFERRVVRSIAHPTRPAAAGWERLVDTQARALQTARNAVTAAAGSDVVLVGHGTSLTVLVAALTGAPPDVSAWHRMRLPDHCCIEWPSRLASPWGHWAAEA